MKKIIVIAAALSMLGACGPIPKKVGEDVRSVEVTGSRVDNDAEELHVMIAETDTKTAWDINLGTDCAGYPFTNGQTFLVRFDKFVAGEGPTAVSSVAPQTDQVYSILCGS